MKLAFLVLVVATATLFRTVHAANGITAAGKSPERHTEDSGAELSHHDISAKQQQGDHHPDLLVTYDTFLDTYAHFRHTIANELQALDLSLAVPANVSTVNGVVESSTNLQVATAQGKENSTIHFNFTAAGNITVPKAESEGLVKLTQAFTKAFVKVVLPKVLEDLDGLALPSPGNGTKCPTRSRRDVGPGEGTVHTSEGGKPHVWCGTLEDVERTGNVTGSGMPPKDCEHLVKDNATFPVEKDYVTLAQTLTPKVDGEDGGMGALPASDMSGPEWSEDGIGPRVNE